MQQLLSICVGACLLLNALCLPAHADTFSADNYRQPPDQWPEAVIHPEAGEVPELAPLPELPSVEWHTSETEALGQQLFFDPRLSGSGQIACASCHDPDLGWADGGFPLVTIVESVRETA